MYKEKLKESYLGGIISAEELIIEASNNLQVRDKVKILKGKFKGEEGTIKDIDNSEAMVKVGGKFNFVDVKDLQKI